jgi:ribonuclease VapC
VTEKKKKLLDSHAALRFLQREKGAEAVEQLLRRAEQGDLHLLMSEINLGEVHYILRRTQGEARGEEIFSSFLLLPIERVAADFDLVLSASKLKAELPVSYADCFAVATAMRYEATVVTGDPEFRRFESRVEIDWI